MTSPESGGTVSLRPRARLVRALGDELISNESVAVTELVKNAYDADATDVLIRFLEPLQLAKAPSRFWTMATECRRKRSVRFSLNLQHPFAEKPSEL